MVFLFPSKTRQCPNGHSKTTVEVPLSMVDHRAVASARKGLARGMIAEPCKIAVARGLRHGLARAEIARRAGVSSTRVYQVETELKKKANQP